MKIAYFSPFPPHRTGIATYSMHLAAELRKLMQVDCYDFNNKEAGNPATDFGDFAATGRISDLADYEAVVYHLGNNPWYHLEIFRTLRQWPGMVVLHDVVLYYLMAGAGIPGLTKHFLLNYGFSRVGEIRKIIADCPDGDILRYPYPERYPMVASIFRYATAIIAHNNHARDTLVALGYSRPIHVVPLLAYPRPELDELSLAKLRERHSISETEIVIGCFGFIGPTKRMDKVCEALSLIKNELSFKLLIVGEGGDLTSVIRDNDLEDRTIQTRFVSNEEFSHYLNLTDIVVNLRFPSMGESSATLIQALTLGKPCIVSNDALFGDLPDECVVKIDVGQAEVKKLSRAIIHLAKDASRRSSLGKAARQFVESHWSGRRVAQKVKTAVEADIKIRAQESLKTEARNLNSCGLASNLIWDKMTSCVPPHLQRTLPAPETWRNGDEGGLSKEEVRWAYRFFLDREPESAAVVEEMVTRFRHRADLREALLHSEEYIRKSGDGFFK